jgi:hypothetical protein
LQELPKVKDQLHDLGCPICSGGDFAVRKRGKPGHTEASCLKCGTVLVIDRGPALQNLPSRWRTSLMQTSCIHCGSHLTRVCFRCEIDTFTRFFVALCRDCSRSFALEEAEGGGGITASPGYP